MNELLGLRHRRSQRSIAWQSHFSDGVVSTQVMIAGNHDHVLETMGVDAVRRVLQPAGIQYLLNSTAAVAGVRIFGLPTSELLHTRNRAFQVPTGQRKGYLRGRVRA